MIQTPEGVDLEKSVSNISKRYNELESRVQELEGVKDPQGVNGRIESAFSEIEVLTDKVSTILQKLNAMNFDHKFVEIFEDDELYKLYVNSGLNMNDAKIFIEHNFFGGDKTNITTIQRYLNGEIKDIKVRNTLGKYFRSCVVRKKPHTQ